MSKAIVVMFDSLNRNVLSPYGGRDVYAPNFERLARHTVAFDNSYVCSMPCMPARRDLQTGRPNFLHRGWGPMEPWDDSMPRLLHNAGVHTHLVTDHYHYFEEGGANYHTKFSTWEVLRGQQGDPWHGLVGDVELSPRAFVRGDQNEMQDAKNRLVSATAETHPQCLTFRHGCDFIERNQDADSWLLQIETFDPHEPFFSLPEYKKHYAKHYEMYRGKGFDWPPYREVRETPEEVAHARAEYASLVSMCDDQLGKLLDLMDRLDLWADTMLVVCTDHGFLLGEHDSWAKCWCPFYSEIARTPFFVWDPRSGRRGTHCASLVQPAIDLAPTLLAYFGQTIPPDVLGRNLAPAIATDEPLREAAIFGMFGSHVNVTDGRYVYMRGPVDPANGPLPEFTLMPASMREAFSVARFQKPLESRAFSFTKGCHAMKLDTQWAMPGGESVRPDLSTKLFDLHADPGQLAPIADVALEERMVGHLRALMTEADAPREQFERLGLAVDGYVSND